MIAELRLYKKKRKQVKGQEGWMLHISEEFEGVDTESSKFAEKNGPSQ